MSECKYCGKQCENEFCCDEHREYQRIYDESEFVSCPECGVRLKKLDVHIRCKHQSTDFHMKYPKLKYVSREYLEYLVRSRKASTSKYFEVEENHRKHRQVMKESQNRDEVQKNISLGVQNFYENETEEHKKLRCESHTIERLSLQSRKNMSDSAKKYYDSLTEEEREEYRQKQIEIQNRDEVSRAKSESYIKTWNNLSKEERERRIDQMKRVVEEFRLNMSVEERKSINRKISEKALERAHNGTHNLLRDDRGACNNRYERLFDDVFSEEFIRDTIRTTMRTLRVFDGWDSEDLSELYREKFMFECDFFNDVLNVDFEIDEEHHFDQIDYDYDRDAHFLKDRATLTFRYRLFDILSREQEVREDMKFVIFELRKGNRDVKSKFEYTKEECRKKWDEYFRQKVLKREFVEGNRDVSNV